MLLLLEHFLAGRGVVVGGGGREGSSLTNQMWFLSLKVRFLLYEYLLAIIHCHNNVMPPPNYYNDQ